jgi:hypothetical protein
MPDLIMHEMLTQVYDCEIARPVRHAAEDERSAHRAEQTTLSAGPTADER